MIEKSIVNYLNSAIDVPVYLEAPKTKPKEYVLFKIIDTEVKNHVNGCTAYFESVSTTLQKTAELNSSVKDAMLNIVSLEKVSGIRLAGGGQNNDEATKTYRYELMFNIYYFE